MRWSLTYGTGSGGSLWISIRLVAGIVSHMSISGESSRSGARHFSPSAGSPHQAPSMITSCRPRRNSGMSGIGGNCIIRAEVLISSGASGAHSAQRFSTSSLRSQGQASMPP